MSFSGRNKYKPTTNWKRSSSKPNLSFSTITEEYIPKEAHFPEDEEKRERTQRLKKLQRLRERRYRDFKGLAHSGITDNYEIRFANDLEEFKNLRLSRLKKTEDDSSSENKESEPNSLRFHNKDTNTLPTRLATRRASHATDTSSYTGYYGKGQVLSPTGSVSSVATLDDRYMYSSRFENEENDYSLRPRRRTYSLSTPINQDYNSSLYSHLNEDGLDDNLFDDTASECDYGNNSRYQKRSFSTCVTPHTYSGMMTPVAMSIDAAATAERLDQITERLRNLQLMRKERELSADKSNDERSRFVSNKDVYNKQSSTSVSNYHTSETKDQSLDIPQDNNDSSRPFWSERINLLMSSQRQSETLPEQNANQESYASNVKIIDGSEPIPMDMSFDQESFYSLETCEDDSSTANMKSTNSKNINTKETEIEYDYTDCIDPESVQMSLGNYNNKFLAFQSNQISENNITKAKPIELIQHTTYIQSHSKQNDFSEAVHPEVQSPSKEINVGKDMQCYKDLTRDELLLEIARLKLTEMDRNTPNTKSNTLSVSRETKSEVKFSPDDTANINITKLELVEEGSKIGSDNIQNQDPCNMPASANKDVDKSFTITANNSKLYEEEIQSESKEQSQSDNYILDRDEHFIHKKEKWQIEHPMYFKSIAVEKPSLETSENIVHKITDEGKLQKQYSPIVKETFEKKQNFDDENLEIISLKDQQNNNSSLESCPPKYSRTPTQLSCNLSETSPNSKSINSDSLATSHQNSLTKSDINFDNSNNLTDMLSKETNSIEIISQNYVQSILDQASKEITVNKSVPTENILTSRKDEKLETKKLSVDVTIKPNNDNISKTKSPEKCNSIAYSSVENEVEMPRVLASSPVFVPFQDIFPTIISKTTIKDKTDSPTYLGELETSKMNETLTCKSPDVQKYINTDANIKESEDSTESKVIEMPIKDKVIEMFKDRDISEIPTDSKNDSKHFQTKFSTIHLAKEDENSESYVLKKSKEITVDGEQGDAVHKTFSADQQQDSKGKSQFFQDCSPKSIIMPHVTENSKIIISTTESSEPFYTSSLSVGLPKSPSQLKKDNVDAKPNTETSNLGEQSVETQTSLKGISSASNSASIYLVPNKDYLSTPTFLQNQLNLDVDSKSDVKMPDYSTTLEQTMKVKAPEVNIENYLKNSKPESSFMQVVKTDANDSSTTYQNETQEKPIACTVDLDALHSKIEDKLNTSEQPIHFNNKTTEPLNVSPQTTLSWDDLDKQTPAKLVNLKVYNEKYQDGSNEDFEDPSMISTKLPINSNNTPEFTKSNFDTCQQENVSIKLSPENNGTFPNYLVSSYQTDLSQSSLTENFVSPPSKTDSLGSTNYAHSNFYKDKDESSILLMKDVPSFDLKDSGVLKSPKSDVGADVKDPYTKNDYNLNSFSTSTSSPSKSKDTNIVSKEFSHEPYNTFDSQTQNLSNITSKNILLTDSPKETTTSKQNTFINIRKQLFGEEINTYDINYMKHNKSALKLVAPDSGTLIKTKFETEGERIQSIIPRSPKKKDYETRQFSDNSEYFKSDTSSKDIPDSSFHIISDSQVVISPKTKAVEIERPVSQSDAQYLATSSLDSLPTIQYRANSNIENVDQHTSPSSVFLSQKELVPEYQLHSNYSQGNTSVAPSSLTSEIDVELSKNTAFPSEKNNSDIKPSSTSTSSESEYVNQNTNSSESDIKYLQESPHLIVNDQPTPQESISLDGSKSIKLHQEVPINNNENIDFSFTFPKTENTKPSSPNIQELENSTEETLLASNKDCYEINAPKHIIQKSNVDENNLELMQNEECSFEETTPTFNKSNSLPRKKTKHPKTLGSPPSSETAITSAEDIQNINKLPSQKKWKSVELLEKGNRKKPEVPPKSSAIGLVKSTSMKFLAKFQSKSKKSKNPEELFPDEDKGKSSTDLLNPALKKGQSEYSVLNSEPSSQQNEFLGLDPAQRTRHYKTLPHKKKESCENAPDKSYKPEREINSLVSPFNTTLPKRDDDMFTEDKQYFSQWDPSALFMDLYNIHLVPDDTQDFSPDFIEMEGVMEKLPMNKKKSTLLKTWKRRYFIAKNGWLVYYDNRGDQQPSDELLLMGGNITIMGNLVIGVDDGRGHYLMVRCPSPKEYEQWLAALQSQTVDNFKANYVHPLLDAPKCSHKNIVIIEMGSMSIRAGILKENATLPQIFFPSVVAVNYSEKKHFVGFEAYKPCNRLSTKLLRLFGISDKIDKFRIEYEILPSIVTAIFQDLKVKPSDYQVMMVLPLHISKKDKENIMEILINRFHVQAVCMVTQAITALYSYNTKSGIVVDIGFAIEGGQSVQSYGAGKIRQSLRSGLAKHNFPLYSPLEQIIVRQVMEQTCYVSKHYEEELQKYVQHPETFFSSVYLNKYNMPNDAYSTISHDVSRFASSEGFFNTDLWGMDYPTVQALVLRAINACPMDNRRHMCRAIYLSGGITMIPGFSARLEKEVQRLVNPSLLVQVHSSPQRYHAAYIGACILSALPEFQNHCISSNEWRKEGTKAFRKWIY